MDPYVIAVLDVDWACRDMLDQVLVDSGYSTIVWDAMGDAFALVQSRRPDLVILDTWLHRRGDGLALLNRLIGEPATAGVPVVVCSSDPHALPALQSLPAPLRYAVVEKPFAVAELLAAVATLLPDRRGMAAPQPPITRPRLRAEALSSLFAPARVP